MPDKDVLGKADALLRRHSIALPGAGSESGAVPVLTEMVEPPPARAQDAPPDLAQAIFERVMHEVDGRLAAAVGDLRQQLASAVGEAIRQELERRHVK